MHRALVQFEIVARILMVVVVLLLLLVVVIVGQLLLMDQMLLLSVLLLVVDDGRYASCGAQRGIAAASVGRWQAVDDVRRRLLCAVCGQEGCLRYGHQLAVPGQLADHGRIVRRSARKREKAN